LGALQVEGRRGFRARYTIGHAPAGSPRDFVRLELFNAEGALDLSRDLPMRGESCTTMAEVIALVLDRHFRSLSPEEHGTPHVDAGPAPEPTSQRPSVAPPAAKPAGRSSGLLGAEYALTPTRSPAVGLRGWGQLGRNLQLGGVLLLDLRGESERLPMAGEARASRAELRGWLAWSVERYPWFGYAGPSLGLSLERGETRDLPQRSTLVRALWAGGLETGGFFSLAPRFGLYWAGSLTFRPAPLSGRFYVDEREVLRPATVQFQLGFGAGYSF
jgi:hypothetical protein